MPTQWAQTVPGKPEPVKPTVAPAGLAYRAGLFILLLICALAVFVFGSNYFKAFPTNGNSLYSASLTAVYLMAALWLKRSGKFARYWPITFALFVASTVNLVSGLFGGYSSQVLRFFGLTDSISPGMAIAKLCEALLVAVPILVLTKLSGADLGSLLIKRGNLKWGLSIGALVLVNFTTSSLIFFGTSYASPDKLGAAVGWGIVFAFSNGFLEELWLRGLFLKKLEPLIGFAGAILLTSVWFAAMHILAVAYLPPAVIPVFLFNTFSLGLACGYLILKTDSLWGAVIIHAAADLFLFIAVLASH
jgi:membrane protease YdiL (CAAX protease family)